MEFPIDVVIYLTKFRESFTLDTYIELIEEYGIDLKDKESFDESFFTELAKASTSNFVELGGPEISEKQIDDAMGTAVVEYHLQKLVEKGLVEEVKDQTDGQIKIQLTDKGHITNLTNNIGLN